VQASIGYNFQSLSCPSNQEGLIIQQQAYAIDSNGNAYDYTDWATISSTCRDFESQAFVPEQTTVADCPAGQVGSNTYTRSYTQWTNGERTNYTGWTWIGGSCYTPAPPPPDPGPWCGWAWIGDVCYNSPPGDPGPQAAPDPGPQAAPDPGPQASSDPGLAQAADAPWCCSYDDGSGGGGDAAAGASAAAAAPAGVCGPGDANGDCGDAGDGNGGDGGSGGDGGGCGSD